MKNETKILTLIDENGKEEKFEIFFTFHSSEYDKSYVVYAPEGSLDNDDDVELLASSYIEDEGLKSGTLSPIEDDEEWNMIEDALAEYIEENDDFKE